MVRDFIHLNEDHDFAESEIEVGATYFCVGRRVRQVLEIRDARTFKEVRYSTGYHKDHLIEQSTFNPLPWFAAQVLRKI